MLPLCPKGGVQSFNSSCTPDLLQSVWPERWPEETTVREAWTGEKGRQGSEACRKESGSQQWNNLEKAKLLTAFTAIALLRQLSHAVWKWHREVKLMPLQFSLNFYAALLPSKVMHGPPRTKFYGLIALNSNPHVPEEQQRHKELLREQERRGKSCRNKL